MAAPPWASDVMIRYRSISSQRRTGTTPGSRCIKERVLVVLGCAFVSVRSEQQAERRSRVVSAAKALAAKGGYVAVQMRSVAQEADVALGTLYRYFSSKDALLLAGLEQLAEDMQVQLAEHPAQGATSHERVTKVLGILCDLLESEPL